MHIEIPSFLDGGTVALRPLTAEDARPYARAFVEDPDLGRLIGAEQDPTAEQVADRIAGSAESAASGRGLQLAVCEPSTGAFLGSLAAPARPRPRERGQRVDVVTFGVLAQEWRPRLGTADRPLGLDRPRRVLGVAP